MEAHSLARKPGGLAIPRSRKLLVAFSDERLVEQLRRGNEVAFEVLYDRHHRSVLSYCRHMLGSRDEAEDALQQAFVSAHRDLISSEKPIRFKAWIYTIARNRCLSILRARREQPSDDIERVSVTGLSEEVQQRADLQQLLADMQELPEEQRAALILSELGDLSHSDIAEVIGCEAAKVKSLVFQARSGLIERRQARETPCEEIREQLATLRGGSLRRGPLRRHLKTCPGCTAFREDVRRQRQMVAAVLPVIPTLGLKESALAAVGMGAGSAGGGLAAGGGAGVVLAAKTGAAKVAIVAIAAGGAVGGSVAVEQATDGSDRDSGAERSAPAGTAVGAGAASNDNGVGSITAEQNSKGAKGDAQRADTARAHGRDNKKKQNGDDPRRGFEPVVGVSNGEAARDFARTRGDGKKLGLLKEREQQARGKAGVRRGQKPKKAKSESPRREPPPQRAEERKPSPPPPLQANPPGPPLGPPFEKKPPVGAPNRVTSKAKTTPVAPQD